MRRARHYYLTAKVHSVQARDHEFSEPDYQFRKTRGVASETPSLPSSLPWHPSPPSWPASQPFALGSPSSLHLITLRRDGDGQRVRLARRCCRRRLRLRRATIHSTSCFVSTLDEGSLVKTFLKCRRIREPLPFLFAGKSKKSVFADPFSKSDLPIATIAR